MLLALEAAEDYSLILIEEVENGLHPLATIRFVEYLIDLASRKKAQVIFTTHSPEALIPLPEEAIWAVLGNTATQGKIDIYTLRSIRGYIDTSKLVIYVEDEFAAKMINQILRLFDENQNVIYAVEVHNAGGYGNVCKFAKIHNEDPAVQQKSIGFIDSDVTSACDDENVFQLPGEGLPPEKYIFHRVLENLDDVKSILTVRLNFPTEKAEWVAKNTRDV